MKDYADKSWLRGPMKYTDAWWRERAAMWREANPHIDKPRVHIGVYDPKQVFAPRRGS